ncbi:hypothetical protein [Nocardia sp. NPDC059229]|uniref:hypothetical protein n=1 Tax=Nocardia sp. NPDC059229 TaxID=3346778 RepID=UPI00369089A5
MTVSNDGRATLAAHQQHSIFAGARVCKTAQLRLVSGAHDPRFEEDIWDLTGLADAPRRAPSHELTLNFAAVKERRWRIVAKEILLAAMAPHHEQVLLAAHVIRKPRSPQTCFKILAELAQWFNWLAEQGISNLDEVTQPLCDRYLEFRWWSAPSSTNPPRRLEPGTVSAAVSAVKIVALYTEILSSDSYRPDFSPWPKKNANQVVGRGYLKGNRTPPVPDHIFEPLLATCLFLVEVIAPLLIDDVVQARTRAIDTGPLPNLTLDRIDELRQALEHLRSTRTPLPAAPAAMMKARATRGRSQDPLAGLSWDGLAGLIGCGQVPPQTKAVMQHELIELAAEVGFQGTGAREGALVPRLDNGESVVWTKSLADRDLLTAASHVVTACLILTAALSGMRNSELRELLSGCCRSEALASGTGVRYKLAGKLIKGQKFGGVADEWVVIEQVHRAIDVAERIQALAPGEALFSWIGVGTRMAYLQGWLKDSGYRDRWGLPQIPSGPVSVRMLRRTLALSIAHRPGGLLAAKVALKHVSVATTEGYAARPGGSQRLFLAEIHAAEQQRHLALTMEAFRDAQAGRMPSGPGARGLIDAFGSIDAALNDAARTDPKVLDDRHLESLLRKLAGSLHVSAANYCWFRDPAKALCLKLAGTPSATKPLAGMCDSARCPQATHHLSHRPVWAAQAKAVEVFLGNPRVAAGEKRRLTLEHERSMRVITAIDLANSTAREQH